MRSDLDIARAATLRPIADVAADAGLPAELVVPYGRDVAKVSLDAVEALADRPRARYVVVSAITPTPLGEGKTTTTVGLGQAFARLGRRATVAVRQPSMGPTFGIKGGAAGGGHSQIVPMERLNLHLTGDAHAVTAAHNLCAAMVDAHVFHGNETGLDPRRIEWRRVLDVDDRSLRNVVVGLGGPGDGIPRESGFDITAASEVMAILALATSYRDLRERLGRVVVGRRRDHRPVTADDVGAGGAMAVIVRDALQPNLLQTLEGTPVLVHTGPFGNIATGNSSVVADLVGMGMGEVLLTEAGFGADMGAERFFNIKCRVSGLVPDAAVLVVTVRALKAHSGRHHLVAGHPLPPAMRAANPDDVRAGGENLRRQIDNIRRHGVTPVVAVNVFPDDHEADLVAVGEIADECGVRWARSTHFVDGGAGATDLARAIWDAAHEPSTFRMLYDDALPLRDKIARVATEIYGAAGVEYAPAARRGLDTAEAEGLGRLPVCIAKTHLSLSSDPTLPGAPVDWTLPVREVRTSVGAGFVYPICGDVRTMPGLGSHPAALDIDLTDDGTIVGLS